jgi:hypothetical protein
VVFAQCLCVVPVRTSAVCFATLTTPPASPTSSSSIFYPNRSSSATLYHCVITAEGKDTEGVGEADLFSSTLKVFRAVDGSTRIRVRGGGGLSENEVQVWDFDEGVGDVAVAVGE